MVTGIPGLDDDAQQCTERTPRVVAARKLLRRAGRERAGRFLVEGAQAVSAALVAAADPTRSVTVTELFLTDTAATRHPEVIRRAGELGARISPITDRAVATLSETVTPQGLVAVVGLVDVPLSEALAATPRLVVVLVDASDPGNAGTVIRVADAAGADAVVLAGDCVDPHNGKCVRASVGSLFHLPLARETDTRVALDACRAAGLRLLATAAAGEHDLHDPVTERELLAEPCAWLLGSEAHGLPEPVLAAADATVRVPIYGQAESLNLASAASICVYATTRMQREARISPEPGSDGGRSAARVT
ncbi:MAG TPA: RNA methyltransferase [Pseudonocardia sp.]|jgi:TrmH family RNA methyltransferase|nr:RNA methyltransferase [Pseudonocardia sp.]